MNLEYFKYVKTLFYLNLKSQNPTFHLILGLPQRCPHVDVEGLLEAEGRQPVPVLLAHAAG